ncbi:MAG: MaoC family dehydratase N-terminal domain-containing protein [Acidimicrobiia bacterium]|nr:MaoC family dehydratase N-terminal domain-containing protein [Acidimicrobiia bacterium]
MTLEALRGRAVAPAVFAVTPGVVARFVAATGDEATRWREFAPPGLAAAAFFAAAPALLALPEVAGPARSLLHTEQAFTWQRALAVGEEVAVAGKVASVRSRGAMHLVTFEVAAAGAAGPWLQGAATFVLSAEAVAAAAEEVEPPPDARGICDPASVLPLPGEGAALSPLRRSASRADLVRYAVAGGDANPIHQDHRAARAAGLPGVIVHGLLLAAWMFQAAARYRPGPHPLRDARVRFRRALRPAVPAVVTGTVAARGEVGALLDLALEAADGSGPVATAAIRVTP